MKEISIRSSTLLTGDGAEVIIPNGDVLSHNIVNWTLSNNHIRVELPVVVDKFPDLAMLNEAFKKILASSSNVLTQREPEVEIASITGKSVTVLFSFWCKNVTKAGASRSEVNTGVYKMLQEKGINMV